MYLKIEMMAPSACSVKSGVGQFICCINMRVLRPGVSPANTKHSHKVGSMLGQRHRRWSNIEPTLCVCLVFAGLICKPETLGQCWVNVRPSSAMLTQ